jgi:hypothetical protein
MLANAKRNWLTPGPVSPVAMARVCQSLAVPAIHIRQTVMSGLAVVPRIRHLCVEMVFAVLSVGKAVLIAVQIVGLVPTVATAFVIPGKIVTTAPWTVAAVQLPVAMVFANWANTVISVLQTAVLVEVVAVFLTVLLLYAVKTQVAARNAAPMIREYRLCQSSMVALAATLPKSLMRAMRLKSLGLGR